MNINMKHFKIAIYGLLLLLSVSLTSSCAWRIRNPSEVPPSLRILYLDGNNLESHFRVQLINLLQSMNIRLVPTPDAAPFVLHATNYSLQHTNPAISTTNVAVTYIFTLTVTVSITDPKGKIIVPPHPITVYNSITISTNQIFSINSSSVLQLALQREASTLIYYWLTSDSTQSYLKKVRT